MINFSTLDPNEVSESRTLRLYKSSEGLLFGEIIDDVQITFDDAQENSKMRATFLDPSNPIPYVCNIKKLLSMDLETRRFVSKDIAGLSCVALVVDSGISKIIGDYAVWINKPTIPTKLFNSIEAAVSWAKEFQLMNFEK